MALKDKVYDKLIECELFRKTDAKTAIIKVAKLLNESENDVLQAVKDLQKDFTISVVGKSLKDNHDLHFGTYYKPETEPAYILDNMSNRKIPVLDAGYAIDSDKVHYKLITDSNGEKACVSKILNKNNNYVLGQVIRNSQGNFVFISDEKRHEVMAVLQDDIAKHAENKKCAVSIKYLNPTNQTSAFAKVESIFGKAGDPIVENEAIAFKYGFTKDFSAEVEQEVESIPSEVSKEEISGRKDLRNKFFMTIDPSTCKDMDDAVYVEKTETGYRAYVAIADVSHYVKRGSNIDKWAFRVGTSCYLGSGVYPMLPEKLSNGICSLNEGVDRLVKVAIVDTDRKGVMTHYEICNGVINSKHKLSYETAEEIHFGWNNKDKEYPDAKNQIDLMYEISDILTELRTNRGAVSFSEKEPTFQFNELRTDVEDIVDRHNVTSHKIIESLMILANEAVGQMTTDNGIYALYRVHEEPSKDKLIQLNNVLRSLGIDYRVSGTGFSFQELFKKIKGTPLEEFVQDYALTAMKKAKYQPDNISHFGLGMPEAYLHFTSPIRRYPDLTIHRTLEQYFKTKTNTYTKKMLDEMGYHLTDQEKKAGKAEVESDKLLSAIWAENNMDKEFVAYVSGICPNGIEAKINLVKVFIPFTELPNGKSGSYSIYAGKTYVKDKISETKIKLGDKLKLKIYIADRATKNILATTDMTKVIHKPEYETNKQVQTLNTEDERTL